MKSKAWNFLAIAAFPLWSLLLTSQSLIASPRGCRKLKRLLVMVACVLSACCFGPPARAGTIELTGGQGGNLVSAFGVRELNIRYGAISSAFDSVTGVTLTLPDAVLTYGSPVASSFSLAGDTLTAVYGNNATGGQINTFYCPSCGFIMQGLSDSATLIADVDGGTGTYTGTFEVNYLDVALVANLGLGRSLFPLHDFGTFTETLSDVVLTEGFPNGTLTGNVTSTKITFTSPVPEPGTLGLIVLGAAAVGLLTRKRSVPAKRRLPSRSEQLAAGSA